MVGPFVRERRYANAPPDCHPREGEDPVLFTRLFFTHAHADAPMQASSWVPALVGAAGVGHKNQFSKLEKLIL
jgi:hypothetical protein